MAQEKTKTAAQERFLAAYFDPADHREMAREADRLDITMSSLMRIVWRLAHPRLQSVPVLHPSGATTGMRLNRGRPKPRLRRAMSK